MNYPADRLSSNLRRSPERQRPPPKLPTTIPLKRNVDVGQQPQRRRAGRCRSVCLRARWNRHRLARAREGSEQAVNAADLSVLQNLAIVADDPVAACPRPAPAAIAAARPGEADVSIGADRPSAIVRPRICEQQFR